MSQKECNLCGSIANYSCDYNIDSVFLQCPVCGRYELIGAHIQDINYNHLASYLAYHAFINKSHLDIEYRYNTFLSKERCDSYNKEFKEGKNTHGRPVHIDNDIIENWYPKTLSARIDMILLYINNHTKHIGQYLNFSLELIQSVFFIDRYDDNTDKSMRSEEDRYDEIEYIIEYMEKCEYILKSSGPSDTDFYDIKLLPEGYRRVDELQKYYSYGKNALVAMAFRDETKPLREAIRKGIREAGYNAIFIDEVQHNEFITPELLKYIRDSKFVVVDLTHKNNGAYFEEGYAMGLGKPVIQLCKKGVDLHFDIAQKNTIIWETEEDIPQRLLNRIKATIE